MFQGWGKLSKDDGLRRGWRIVGICCCVAHDQSRRIDRIRHYRGIFPLYLHYACEDERKAKVEDCRENGSFVGKCGNSFISTADTARRASADASFGTNSFDTGRK